MKRILSLILLFACVMISRGEEIGGINYEAYWYTDTPNAIVKSLDGRKYTGSITIPSSILVKGKRCTVNEINAFAFFECTSLTSINIPNTVTKIGQDAFAFCM